MSTAALDVRPVALITGAHGGMGAACARVFARSNKLVLTDRNAAQLDALRSQLEADGAAVLGTVAGDISDPATIERAVAATSEAGQFGALVHCAGLSPSLAGWRAILDVNLVASIRLLDAIEPLLRPGAVAVLVASIAGHMARATPEITAAIDAILERGDTSPLAAVIGVAGDEHATGASYGLSKYGVMRLVQKRAKAWGQKGARIVSISPGLIATSMGRTEASANPMAASLLTTTPIARWGTANDIASAAEFLCSDRASFITGCDLRVDGGAVAAQTM